MFKKRSISTICYICNVKNSFKNNQDLRILSQIFSPPMFEKIVRDGDFLSFEKKTKKYIDYSKYNNNLEIIRALYKSLQKDYRCEYIYKNNLMIDIINSYSLKDSLIINELKVGSSKADLVLLNGIIRIYEIKTELDDFTKLSKQLDDYQKFADKVYIVTDEKSAKKLILEYDNTNIGINILDQKNNLITFKEAKENSSFFDFETIFKILRKNEYLDLVRDNFGIIPDVPNTKIFRLCYELLSQLEISKFQKQVLNKLKERKLMSPRLLKSNKTPKELKHICNSLNFNDKEYQNLYNFLKTYNPCINPI